MLGPARVSVWKSDSISRSRVIVLLAMVAVCLLVTGCGNDLAQVSGVVTVGGEPLRGGNDVRATVIFQPASGQGSTGVSLLDENGEYQLSTGSRSGLAPGEYLVTCTATQLVPSKTPGGLPGGKRITHPKYANTKTSGLRFNVHDGNNQIDIPLEAAP